MSLHRVRFDCHRQSSVAYGCNQPGDNTGEYVQAADAMDVIEALAEALKAMVDRYAPSYHDCTDDGMPECEICDARAALAKARGEA